MGTVGVRGKCWTRQVDGRDGCKIEELLYRGMAMA